MIFLILLIIVILIIFTKKRFHKFLQRRDKDKLYIYTTGENNIEDEVPVLDADFKFVPFIKEGCKWTPFFLFMNKNYKRIEDEWKYEPNFMNRKYDLVYSNSNCDKGSGAIERYNLFSVLKTISSNVHSIGKCQTTHRVEIKTTWNNNGDIFKDYKFCIAIENSIYPGYITEKILNAYKGGCIPIIWSGKHKENKEWYEKLFNKNTFLDLADYDSFNDIKNEIVLLLDGKPGLKNGLTLNEMKSFDIFTKYNNEMHPMFYWDVSPEKYFGNEMRIIDERFKNKEKIVIYKHPTNTYSVTIDVTKAIFKNHNIIFKDLKKSRNPLINHVISIGLKLPRINHTDGDVDVFLVNEYQE